jgi:metal-responsive CopG/Arc/MetJ family transcriptional regulator
MKTVKTAISIPTAIFKAADKFARRLGISRSELYSKAVSEYLKKHNNEKITQKLDEIYEKEPSNLDSVLQKIQSASFSEDKW